MERYLKICPIFLLFFVFTAEAQTITNFSVEDQFDTDLSVWVSTPAGQSVNTQLEYASGGDTLFTEVQTQVSNGISQEFTFEGLSFNCDSASWAVAHTWIAGGDTVSSAPLNFTVPCPGLVEIISFTAQSFLQSAIMIDIGYDSGGWPADLYFVVTINEEVPVVYHEVVSGVGTYSTLIPLQAGDVWAVCNPEINNGEYIDVLISCFSDGIEIPEPEPVVANLVASYEDETLVSELHIQTSGWETSSFEVAAYQVLCDGTLLAYETFTYSFTELVTDSVLQLPVLENLPQSSEWVFVLQASNVGYFLEDEIVVDVADGIETMVSINNLVETENGFYEVFVGWDDMGAGNPILEFYVEDELVGQAVPNTNSFVWSIPVQISSYEATLVEVILTSNSCFDANDLELTEICSSPTHILETATSITQTEALVQVSFANFYGCVDEAHVGVVLVNQQDTIWTMQSVNTQQSSNYLIQLSGLQPGTTYLYQAVLCAEGSCFPTNFTLSFTTLPGDPTEPYFTNFTALWDNSGYATVFTGFNLTGLNTVKLRIKYTEPGSPEVVDLDIPVSGQSHAHDLLWDLVEGTHFIVAELYDSVTNVVYATAGPSVYTYQALVSVTELNNRPVTRFDRVDVYDLSGRLVAVFSNGTILQPQGILAPGIYIFQGVKEGINIEATKIYLGQ